MTTRRLAAMAGGAVAPIVLLALVFGNQWVAEAVLRGSIGSEQQIRPLTAALQFPQWRLTPTGDRWVHVLTVDFSLLLYLVLVGVLVFGAARMVEQSQGMLGAVIAGWWAAAVAGAVAGFVGGALNAWAIGFPSGRYSMFIWGAIGNGTNFGVIFGWLAGLGALGGFMVTRPKQAVQQPYGGQQPYGMRQPGVPMPQQGVPQGVPQQPVQPHPSAVPYVPPQGQPQQPPWGGPGVPGQPGGPQQPGAPYAPQPPAQPQQPSARPSAQAPAEQKPESPEPERAEGAGTSADEDAEKGSEKAADQGGEESGSAGAAPFGDASAEADEDDDLDLADRTVIDPRRDDG